MYYKEFGVVALILGTQVLVAQEPSDPPADPPVEEEVVESDSYDLQLYAAESENDTTAVAIYGASTSSWWMSSGDFEYESIDDAFSGSWFGFSWGPVGSRMGVGKSAGGDAVLLKSIFFGDLMLGRAMQFGEVRSRFFVIGSKSVPLDEEAPSDQPADPAEPDAEGSVDESDPAVEDEPAAGDESAAGFELPIVATDPAVPSGIQ